MGLHQRDIATLVGRVIIGIDVDDHDVEIHTDNGDEFILTAGPDGAPGGIGDIEGDMADLCESPITGAQYRHSDGYFLIETVNGAVTFNIEGEAALYRVL